MDHRPYDITSFQRFPLIIVRLGFAIPPTGTNCAFRKRGRRPLIYDAGMTTPLTFTPGIQAALNYERYHHPDPLVQRR